MRKLNITILSILFFSAFHFASAATITEVVMASPSGESETFRSDDDEFLETPPPFKSLTLSSNNWYCKKNSKSASVLSRQIEKGFELDFLVKSLVNRKSLTRNQKKEVLRTPDCRDFRFNLHIIAMIEEQGYRLKKVAEIKN